MCDAKDSLCDAKGSLCEPEGDFSDAEEARCDAEGDFGHAEGSLCDTESSLCEPEGSLCDTEGSVCEPEGDFRDAEGSFCDAEGSVCEPQQARCDAEGDFCDTEGSLCDAEGDFCAAEGSLCAPEGAFREPEGDFGHAEGACCDTTGVCRLAAPPCPVATVDPSCCAPTSGAVTLAASVSNMEPRKTAGGEESREHRERLAELVLRRTALSPSEAELFREVFPEIFAAHYDRVWSVLRRRGARDAALEDLVQDVFLAFFNQVLTQGFPDSIPAKLLALASGMALNQIRGDKREPLTLGVPSSGSEKPRSAPEAERALDLATLAQRLLPALSKEHQEVVEAIILRELTHDEAAAELGIPRRTVTSRLLAAKRRLFELAALFFPKSQRGPL